VEDVNGDADAQQVPDKHADGDEDTPMSSNPFPSSSAPQPPQQAPTDLRRVLTLAREEDLEAAKVRFIEVTAVHIYSLESVSLKNIQMLSTPNRLVAANFANEDPLECYKQYGVIQNPNVRVRSHVNLPLSGY
jgi:DNA polymerase delta subunit 3